MLTEVMNDLARVISEIDADDEESPCCSRNAQELKEADQKQCWLNINRLATDYTEAS